MNPDVELSDWNWFRRRGQGRADRELSVRLEERHRERNRIARELHDPLSLMHRMMDEGRSVLQEPRSPGMPCLPLEQALGQLRDEFILESGLRLRIFVTGQPRTLNPALQDPLYLIGREALLNAL